MDASPPVRDDGMMNIQNLKANLGGWVISVIECVMGVKWNGNVPQYACDTVMAFR